ncbi:hypothetical protein DVH24_036193 [Malus domestica]|uniref:Uncharacterized protein n=1 Tax=Malus domestica TaxID=3750 RepID=A0A498IIH3_MALDO|nr:hypothetical protein DVH24_036193 [Malus domestica]
MTWLHTIPLLGSLETRCPVIRVAPNKTLTIYGVARTIRLLTGNYALVITSRKEVGTYLSFPVYRVTSMRFLFCNCRDIEPLDGDKCQQIDE